MKTKNEDFFVILIKGSKIYFCTCPGTKCQNPGPSRPLVRFWSCPGTVQGCPSRCPIGQKNPVPLETLYTIKVFS